TSLALDGDGHPHISYQDFTTGALKYARFDGTSWQLETVDTGFVGFWNSLALDGDGHPHISYHDLSDFTTGDLRYARFDGTSWQLETVDGDGDVGRFTSLALDDAGNPHISYYDDTNDALKHAAGSLVTDSDGDGVPDEADPDTVGAIVSGLSADDFNAPGNQTALLSRLEEAEALIQDWYETGDTVARDEAIRQLENLLRRLDGCGTSPDSNDWITDCTAQIEVRGAIQTIIDTLLAA
ncbi:MAG: hypothetical protein ACRDNY_03485, partial [Gaiellaceae bacterium]